MTTTTRTITTPNGTETTRDLVHASSITGVGGTAHEWGGDIGTASRIFRVWVNRLQHATIMDRGMIGQFTTGILPRSHGGDFGGASTNLTTAEASALRDMFSREAYKGGRYGGYRLTDEHEEFGREWLRSNWARLWKEFNPPDDLIDASQVMPTDTFLWIGWNMVADGTWYRAPSYVPVYTARYLALDGEVRTFAYHWSAWQSGGGR